MDEPTYRRRSGNERCSLIAMTSRETCLAMFNTVPAKYQTLRRGHVSVTMAACAWWRSENTSTLGDEAPSVDGSTISTPGQRHG